MPIGEKLHVVGIHFLKNPDGSVVVDQPGMSPDEFPYASTVQGGTGSTVVGVSISAQRSQGGMLQAFYSSNKVKVGDWFLVKAVP